jgi:hypothetical protein
MIEAFVMINKRGQLAMINHLKERKEAKRIKDDFNAINWLINNLAGDLHISTKFNNLIYNDQAYLSKAYDWVESKVNSSKGQFTLVENKNGILTPLKFSNDTNVRLVSKIQTENSYFFIVSHKSFEFIIVTDF